MDVFVSYSTSLSIFCVWRYIKSKNIFRYSINCLFSLCFFQCLFAASQMFFSFPIGIPYCGVKCQPFHNFSIYTYEVRAKSFKLYKVLDENNCT